MMGIIISENDDNSGPPLRTSCHGSGKQFCVAMKSKSQLFRMPLNIHYRSLCLHQMWEDDQGMESSGAGHYFVRELH